MTTRVTVDAHAGWPVEVTSVNIGADGEKYEQVKVVPPFALQDFYVHDHCEIHVKELPHESA